MTLILNLIVPVVEVAVTEVQIPRVLGAVLGSRRKCLVLNYA